MDFVTMANFAVGFVLDVVKQFVLAVLTCIFMLGGALVGTIVGAIAGQTTETGFLGGAGMGAVGGSVVAIELSQSLILGDSLSKMDIFGSLMNEKILKDWIEALDTSNVEVWDVFDVDGTKGLSPSCIKKLPMFTLCRTKTMDQCDEICCSICLQDFKQGVEARRLPKCRHFFHLNCIDEWLAIQGSCPICRKNVLC